MNVILVLGCFLTVVNARGSPPSISIPQGNHWSEPIVYVRKSNEPKTFECSAVADPPARYNWTFNGAAIDVEPSKLSFDVHTGTLSTGPRFDEDESGDYQCYAFNEYGTAMTPIIKILATVANTFKGQQTSTTDKEIYESEYLKLECKDVPYSVPQWQFSWEKGNMVDNKLQSSPVDVGERMVIDQDGNLHFLWTERSDGNRIYACATRNDVMLVSVRNTQTIRLNVKPGLTEDRSLRLMYHQDVEVYAGQTAKLMCIFTYYSTTRERFEINWFHNGENVGQGTELVLEKVLLPSEEQNMEGEYMCEATLGNSIEFGKVNLKIVAPPAIIKNQWLEPKSVPLEEDAVFNCETKSHNSYSQPPVWLVNAVPLLGCPPRHFECATKRDDSFSQCVPEKAVCNNIPDCNDDSDEYNCPGSCSESQKRCGDECIPQDSPCQELQCDYPGFMCRDKKGCLPSEKICDGVEDCSSGFEEFFCPGREIIQRNRFLINSQRTQLIIPNVGLRDSMCIQCMVTNDYGTTIGDGCLTVIDKIVVLRGPNSTYNVEPGTLIDIIVEATTDRQWQKQMKFSWFWYQEIKDKKTGDLQIVPVQLPPKGTYGRFFRVSQKGKSMVIQFPEVRDDDSDAYTIYNTMKDRVYTLVIEHKYDRVEVNFTISGVEIVEPTGAPVVEAAATNLWFIALILAILILFIVVALIVRYMYRNRGGTYMLDKKEQQAGHDPAQELKDSGFHDVGRVDDDYDDDKPKGDEASLSESVKPYESDDDPTEEYGGDFDVSKFNEDGSFIGLYGDKKSKYAKEATV